MANTLELTTPYLPEYADDSDADEPDGVARLLAGEFSALFGGTYATLQEDEEWPTCKMCERPLVPYLQINASSAHTPAAFRACLDFPPSPSDGGVTLFQIFVCTGEGMNGSCLEDWISGAHPGAAMLMRRVHFDASAEASELEDPEDNGALPQRVISSWTAGNPEVPHFELLDEMDGVEYDEEFYEAHEPATGLKLLGNAVLGKVQNCPDGDGWCRAHGAEAHHDYRCLVQLGTDEGDTFTTAGNTFIYQCKQHADVLQPGYGFSW